MRPLGVGFSVSNEAARYAGLIARLRPLRAKCIVLEATGGYERVLWLALSEAGASRGSGLTRISVAPIWLAYPITERRLLGFVAGAAVQSDPADQAIAFPQCDGEAQRTTGCVVLLYPRDPLPAVGSV